MVFIGVYAKAQDTVSNIVSITLPKKTEKISKSAYFDHLHRNYKNYNTGDEKVDGFFRKTYKIDNILIKFYDADRSYDPKKTLVKFQNQFLEMMKWGGITVNFSKIITVNNIQFLVYEHQIDDEMTINFISETKNNKCITGELKFKKADDEKAQQILDKLLKSMHYKER